MKPEDEKLLATAQARLKAKRAARPRHGGLLKVFRGGTQRKGGGSFAESLTAVLEGVRLRSEEPAPGPGVSRDDENDK